MKILNIYVDESGDLGSKDKSSNLYVISFVFYEQSNDITNNINILNNKLKKVEYTKMIHMADLISKRNDYKNFDINTRRKIFNIIYCFSNKINIKYKTIIINKKYSDNKTVLNMKITKEIEKILKENEKYLLNFNKIILYYDNGQKQLGKLLDQYFYKFNNYNHIIDFNHTKERLFQVADMLTYLDKYEYNLKNKIKTSKMEQYFFKEINIKKIFKEINKKRL